MKVKSNVINILHQFNYSQRGVQWYKKNLYIIGQTIDYIFGSDTFNEQIRTDYIEKKVARYLRPSSTRIVQFCIGLLSSGYNKLFILHSIEYA